MKRENVESTEVFEWYDGLVLGLVRTKDLLAFVFLLAFDPDRKQKRFCLIPLSEEQANKLRNLFKEGGPQALDKQVFLRLFPMNQVRFLTQNEPTKGQVLELIQATPVQNERLPVPSFPMIDRAVVASAISEWLSQ